MAIIIMGIRVMALRGILAHKQLTIIIPIRTVFFIIIDVAFVIIFIFLSIFSGDF